MCFSCRVFYFSAREAEVRVWGGVLEGSVVVVCFPFAPAHAAFSFGFLFFLLFSPRSPRRLAGPARGRGRPALPAPARRWRGAPRERLFPPPPRVPGAVGGGGGRERRRLRGAAGALGEQGEPGTGEAGHGLRVVAGGCVLSLCQKISGWVAWSLLVLRRFSHGSALLLHPAAGASRSAAGRGSDAEMKAGGGAGARRI